MCSEESTRTWRMSTTRLWPRSVLQSFSVLSSENSFPRKIEGNNDEWFWLPSMFLFYCYFGGKNKTNIRIRKVSKQKTPSLPTLPLKKKEEYSEVVLFRWETVYPGTWGAATASSATLSTTSSRPWATPGWTYSVSTSRKVQQSRSEFRTEINIERLFIMNLIYKENLLWFGYCP